MKGGRGEEEGGVEGTKGRKIKARKGGEATKGRKGGQRGERLKG